MKTSFALAIIGCFLSATVASSYHTADSAHAAVMSYAHQNVALLPMMRSNIYHLDCFNGFLPLINSFATKARDVSNGCSYKATFDKDQTLQDLEEARAKIAAQIDEINKSLSDCSNLAGLDYFFCYQDIAEGNRVRMQAIREQSQEVMKKSNDKTTEIEADEQSCIMKAIDNARDETDRAYSDLKDCIKTGPVIQTQIDGESSGETN